MKKVVMIMLTASLLMPLAANAESVAIVADPWCPYSCEPGTDRPGYGIEMAVEIFGPAGLSVEYSNMDWDTAVKETRAGKYSAVIGAYKEDAPDFVFPENEFGFSSNGFFVRKGDPWKYNGIDSLKGKTVGIIEGYAYGDGIDEYLKSDEAKVYVATGEDALATLMEKLMKGDVDVVVEDPMVFQLAAKDMYLSKKVSMAGKSAEEYPLYIAFSPALPDSEKLAKDLSDGIGKLRKSGQLNTILKKYGLTDWR